MQNISNKLLDDCLKGDRVAQMRLYDITLPYLRGVVRRYVFNSSDWNDVLQEAYLKIFRHLHQFDGEKGTFISWGARIAINSAIDYTSKSSLKWVTFEELLDSDVFTLPTAIEILTAEEITLELKKMPTDFYLVFMLYIVDGFSHKEIASMLGITTEASRQRHSRAKKWAQANLSFLPDVVTKRHEK